MDTLTPFSGKTVQVSKELSPKTNDMTNVRSPCTNGGRDGEQAKQKQTCCSEELCFQNKQPRSWFGFLQKYPQRTLAKKEQKKKKKTPTKFTHSFIGVLAYVQIITCAQLLLTLANYRAISTGCNLFSFRNWQGNANQNRSLHPSVFHFMVR